MFSKKVTCYLNNHYGIAGKYENNNVLKDITFLKDFYNGSKSIELCEVRLNKLVLNKLVTKKTKLVIGSNLDNQLTSLSYALSNQKISCLGIYSACASFVEGLIIASKFASKKDDVIVITSSHNLVSEKQFKYPIEYGSPLKKYATFTTTGAIGVIVNKIPSALKITDYTIGNVVDYEVSDVANMGAVMAPGAYETIKQHLLNFKRDINYYDLILTGDLGKYGLLILKDLLKEDNIIPKNIMDAGSMLYPNDDKKAGGSGPVCLPLILFNNILLLKKHQRILLVGTGALHSKVMVDQKLTIPAISHVISLEVKR